MTVGLGADHHFNFLFTFFKLTKNRKDNCLTARGLLGAGNSVVLKDGAYWPANNSPVSWTRWETGNAVLLPCFG